MLEITFRRNGEIFDTLVGSNAQFQALADEPESFIARALNMNTGDPERPGKVRDWLPPGWKFDIDFCCDEADRLVDIVIEVREPKRRLN